MTPEESSAPPEDGLKALKRDDKPVICVGSATCGRSAGALQVLETIKKELSNRRIDAEIIQVGCLGLCYVEPLIYISKPGHPCVCYRKMTPELAKELINDYLVNDDPRPDLALGIMDGGKMEMDNIPSIWEHPMLKPQIRIVLRNCGLIDPENIDHYLATDGYLALRKALQMKPEEVIDEIKCSGLRGRGGAGFPTGIKWEFCRNSPGNEKYLICNADEGDPGAFMDRSVLEGDPHSVLEGMVITAYAIGASTGYIYCRAEYPLALERVSIAIQRAREHGFLGKDILGSGFNFDVSIKQGAGAFVCGEETALMASIEGKRGMPRSRPPFPAVSGLWGKPTNINNVETFANVPVIISKGARWYNRYGTEKSKGTKTFALAGKVKRTGLIEVPFGSTLRDVIYGIGGGIADDKQFKAVQTGGPSGGCLPAKLLDLPIEYETMDKAGSIIGSGGMIVTDEDTCIVDFAKFFITFTQQESCGKCVPCRVGTKQMLNVLERITNGEGKLEDMDQLQRLAMTVKNGSLCALGGTAPNPVLTTLQYFRDEYEAHIIDKRCPAKVCKALINYYIDPDRCVGCGICLKNCPVDAIEGGSRMIHVIDQGKCTKCGTCFDVCPPKVKAVIKVSGEKVAVPENPMSIVDYKKSKKSKSKKSKKSKESEGVSE